MSPSEENTRGAKIALACLAGGTVVAVGGMIATAVGTTLALAYPAQRLVKESNIFANVKLPAMPSLPWSRPAEVVE